MSNAEPQPVLVIHGIAIRGEERYARMVAKLNERLGDHLRLIPVYWGDLGASAEHLDRLMGRHPTRSADGVDMMADAMRGAMASGVGRVMSWVQRQQGESQMASLSRYTGSQIRKRSHRRMRGYLNDRFQDARLLLTSAVLPVMTDTIVYQSIARRQAIHQRVRQVIARELPGYGTPDRPVHVIGHSLGGVIAFDMAVEDVTSHPDGPLCLDRFITLGSQPALFHMLDPRPGVLPAFGGEAVTLPPTIGHWTNIWDVFDVLGFAVDKVFALHDGKPPHEVPVRCYFTALEGAGFFQSHIGYWQRMPAIRRMREAFEK